MHGTRPNRSDEDCEWDPLLNSGYDHKREPQDAESAIANANSAENVLAEVGLVLVAALGIVLAVNAVLLALHIG